MLLDYINFFKDVFCFVFMIGYVCSSPSNDVFLYFEGKEIDNRGGRGYLFDEYLRRLGDLEVSVGETKMDLVEVIFVKEDDVVIGGRAVINPRYYDRFVEMGSCEDHQGYRHVSLLDVERLDVMEMFGYKRLVAERERLNED